MTDGPQDDRLCELPDCPGWQRLRAYALGDLPEREIEQVSRCAARCRQCEDTLQRLEDATDDVLLQLRAAAQIPFEGSSAKLDALLVQVETMLAEESVQSGDVQAERRPGGLPQVLGQYRILNLVGSGATGAVFRAEHVRLGKVVALKVLSPERCADREAVQRFAREMQAVGRIEHKHIVSATDAGEADGWHFLVMEFVEGCDAGRLVKARGTLPIPEACEIIRQAAIGLQYAQERGIVHRDVKPSNLLLTTGGQVKVGDLGLARLPSGAIDDDELTATGQFMGTRAYVAPEQIDDARQVDGRSDLYGLGCTLYKLLSGNAPPRHLPWAIASGQERTLADAPIPPILHNRPDVPAELVRLLGRLCAERPEHRLETAAELAAALEPFAQGADLSGLLAQPATAGVLRNRVQRVDEIAYGQETETAHADSSIADGAEVGYGRAAASGFEALARRLVHLWRGSDRDGANQRQRGIGIAVGLGLLVIVLSAVAAIAIVSFAWTATTPSLPEARQFDSQVSAAPANVLQTVTDEQSELDEPIEEGPPGLLDTLPGHWAGINTLAITPDGKYLLSGSDGTDNPTGRVWDLATRELVGEIETGPNISWIDCSLGSRALICPYPARTRFPGDEYSLEIRSIPDLERQAIVSTSVGEVREVAVSPDGRRAYLVYSGGRLETWDLKSYELIARSDVLSQFPRMSVTVSADGQRLYRCSPDKMAVVRDASDLAEIGMLGPFDDEASCLRVVPGHDDWLLVGGLSGGLELWDARAGRRLRKYDGHEQGVYSFAFLRGTLFFVTGSADGTARFWHLDHDQELFQFRAPSATVHVAATPDNRTLASAGGKWWMQGVTWRIARNNAIHLWRMPTIAELERRRNDNIGDAGP